MFAYLKETYLDKDKTVKWWINRICVDFGNGMSILNLTMS
jgi:hypothetical protein